MAKAEYMRDLKYSKVESSPHVEVLHNGKRVITSIFAIIPAVDLPDDNYFLPITKKHNVQLLPAVKKDVDALLWMASIATQGADGADATPQAERALEAARLDMEMMCNPEHHIAEVYPLINYAPQGTA